MGYCPSGPCGRARMGGYFLAPGRQSPGAIRAGAQNMKGEALGALVAVPSLI